MVHCPGIINPADDLTKPLGWVLHSRHARFIMGHFRFVSPTSTTLTSTDTDLSLHTARDRGGS
jgi:hypothetical protein